MRGIHVFVNGQRGLPVIERLCDVGHDVASVITPVGKPVPGLERVCGLRSVGVRTTNAVNEDSFLAEMRVAMPELFVIAGFPTIFTRPLYSLPRLGTINLHGGPVPRYRGGSPLNWQMINGEKTIGITVLRVDNGIDTGPVVAEANFLIGPRDTIAEVHNQANGLFPDLVVKAISQVEENPDSGRVQNESAACYWHQRNDSDGRLNFAAMTAIQIDRMVRALSPPYPGAFAYLGDRKVRLFRALIPDFALRGCPGRVCYIQGRGPYVVCSDRAILLEKHAIEGDATARLRHGDVLQ